MLAIKAFSIKNFKTYGPEQKLPLKRINLLFGPNSHGKSTALTALAVLANSFMKRKFSVSNISHIDNSPDIVLRDKVINNRNDADTFTLSCEFSTLDNFDNELYLKPVFEIDNLVDGELKRFSLYEKYEGKEELFFEIQKDFITINFESYYYKDSLIRDPFDKTIENEKPLDTGRKTFKNFKNLEFDLKTLSITNVLSTANINDEEKRKLINKEYEIGRFIEKQLKDIFYLFELSWTDDIVGWIGPNRTILNKNITVNQEKGFIEDRFLTPETVEKMNRWINKTDTIDLDYIFVLEQRKSKAGISLKEIGLKDQDNDEFLTLYEVGSGIAHIYQILLPFFSDIYGLIVQQPEIHLHPSMQVQLARSMIELASKNNVQLIIETHSEHFIKAAQLEIARSLNFTKPVLMKDDLSVLYISKDKDGYSKVKQMLLDETGAFTETWPDDFFELSADLTMERLRNSFRSRN